MIEMLRKARMELAELQLKDYLAGIDRRIDILKRS
jgi:hypothetical protein